MNKRKKIFLIVALLMSLLLIAMIFGYSYAKYYNSKEVSGTSATAIWNFDGAISKEDNGTTKTISLANTLDGSNPSVEGKIAPGTNGSFKIIVNAKGSEVDVDYDVLLKDEESGNKPDNLFFTCNDLEKAKDENNNLIKYYSLADMFKIDEETERSNLHGTIEKDSNDLPKVITVNWEWPYESTRTGKTLE